MAGDLRFAPFPVLEPAALRAAEDVAGAPFHLTGWVTGEVVPVLLAVPRAGRARWRAEPPPDADGPDDHPGLPMSSESTIEISRVPYVGPEGVTTRSVTLACEPRPCAATSAAAVERFNGPVARIEESVDTD